MSTLLINEQFVSQFKYWREGQIWTGMRFRNDLFEFVSEFNRQQRHEAFDLAWRLAQSGKESIVTATSSRYTVWLNLRVATNSAAGDWSYTPISIEALNYSTHNSSLEAALSA
jgi:hypothetical protein